MADRFSRRVFEHRPIGGGVPVGGGGAGQRLGDGALPVHDARLGQLSCRCGPVQGQRQTSQAPWVVNLSLMRRASFFALAFLSLGVAGYAVFAYAFWPLGRALHPDMRVAFEAHPVGIYTHVFASVIALVLGPFQLSARLRSAHLGLHRWMGRLYLGVGVLVGGLAGLFMAFHAYGGLVSRLGFGSLAVAWLYTGLRAWLAIRSGDTASHRRWMVRNFALTFAAVTLRLWLPAAVVSGVPFELAYPVIAWLCWLPNLVVAERFFNQAHDPAIARPHPAPRP